MCSMEQMTTCQITFTPISKCDYIEEINKVIEIIKSYNVELYVGLMSTTVRGTRATVLKLVNDVYTSMYDQCSFSVDFHMSNVCGC